MNLDNYIEGDFDSWNPVNRTEEDTPDFEVTILDSYLQELEAYKRFVKGELKDYAEQTENFYLINKIKKL